MVLVDSTMPAWPAKVLRLTGNAGSYNAMGRVSALVSISARLRLGHLYGLVAFGSLPPQSRHEVPRQPRDREQSPAASSTSSAQSSASAEQAASLRDFAAKPLVVLTAGSGAEAGWPARQSGAGGPVDEQCAARHRRRRPQR